MYYFNRFHPKCNEVLKALSMITLLLKTFKQQGFSQQTLSWTISFNFPEQSSTNLRHHCIDGSHSFDFTRKEKIKTHRQQRRRRGGWGRSPDQRYWSWWFIYSHLCGCSVFRWAATIKIPFVSVSAEADTTTVRSVGGGQCCSEENWNVTHPVGWGKTTFQNARKGWMLRYWCRNAFSDTIGRKAQIKWMYKIMETPFFHGRRHSDRSDYFRLNCEPWCFKSTGINSTVWFPSDSYEYWWQYRG